MSADDGFTPAVNEVKRSLIMLFLFETIINTILVFLLMLLLLSLFRIPLIYPAAISGVYFIYTLRKKLLKNKIQMVESRYKNVNEKLRTAAEYKDSRSRVVRELQSEVILDLRNVEQSSFINEKKIYVKSIGILLLSFLVIFLSPVNFNLFGVDLNFFDDKIENPIKEIFDADFTRNIEISGTPEDVILKKASDDIYGVAAVAQLGNDEIKIKIKPASTELNIRELQEADLPDFSESYPKEVAAVTAENYQESIPKEDLEMVKSYFNNLAANQ